MEIANYWKSSMSIFIESFTSIGKIFFLGRRLGSSLKFNEVFDITLNFPNLLRSYVLGRQATRKVTRVYQFISNNQGSFHLWCKENLVKHQKFSNYYDHVCLQNFLLHFKSLLKGGSRAPATSKMERFVIIVNGFSSNC